VVLAGTDFSEEFIASIIGVERISDVGTILAVIRNCRVLLMLVVTRATRSHIPEDGTLHSHGRENNKFYFIINYITTKLLRTTIQ
jgi:hypothetical protein